MSHIWILMSTIIWSFGGLNICLMVMISTITLGCLRPVPGTSQQSVGDSPLGSSENAEAVNERVFHVVDDIRQQRLLSNETHAAWQVLHGILAYGSEFHMQTDEGERPALQYLIGGGDLSGWQFSSGDHLSDGRTGLRAVLESGSYAGQGHSDQWLAVLAQADLPLDQEMIVHGKKYLMKDFLAQSKADVSKNVNQEWSWTLIGLTQYLSTDSSWVAEDGREWSIEQLVGSEVDQPLVDSACGGTHRLIGISMALAKRRLEGGALNGVWRRADAHLAEAIEVVKRYQNSDGTFSSNYLARPGTSADNAKLIATTGHMLEFLALTLRPEQLKQPWVERAVLRLCELLEDSEQLPLECGALYHAVHGLVVYRERAFPEA